MHSTTPNAPTPTAFDFQGIDVRTLTINDEPWFVLGDVCKVLEIGNVGMAKNRLDQADISTTDVWSDANNRAYSVAIINESGLYDAILDSRKPQAKKFRRWITSEVIPTIRKTGAYGTIPELTGPELMAKALIHAEATIKDLEARADTAEAALQSAAPVLDYHEKYVAEDDDLLTVDNWARQVGISGPKARSLLIDKNIIFKQSVGSRWSQSKQRMVTEYEYRARQGRATTGWFQLRPQHNAPRLHNGQVRQTLYVRAYFAADLAKKLGLDTQYKELSA